MNKILKIIGICWCYLLFSPPAIAVEPKIKVSVPSFPPFYFAEHKDSPQCQGVVIDILSLLAKELDDDFDIVNYPYARILHTLKMGKLDLALIFKNQAIAQYVDYIGPISKSKVVILTRATNVINQYADLTKLNAIAVIRNASFEQQFDHDSSLKKVDVDSYTQALKMFRYGRVDAVVGSVVGLEYASIIEKVNVKHLSIFQLGEKEWWLHLSKKSPYRFKKEQLERAVNKIYQADLVAQLYHQQMKKCAYH